MIDAKKSTHRMVPDSLAKLQLFFLNRMTCCQSCALRKIAFILKLVWHEPVELLELLIEISFRSEAQTMIT